MKPSWIDRWISQLHINEYGHYHCEAHEFANIAIFSALLQSVKGQITYIEDEAWQMDFESIEQRTGSQYWVRGFINLNTKTLLAVHANVSADGQALQGISIDFYE